MPELPEVETIRKGLSELILGQTIVAIKVDWPGSVYGINGHKAKSNRDVEQFFSSPILNSKIKGLKRRGKVIISELSGNFTLLFHLKMTGQLVLEKPLGVRLAGGHPTKSMAAKLPDSSTRVIFTFASGDKLFFNDQRKFGWIKLVKTSDVNRDLLIARMGPEPLTNDFKLADFSQKLSKRRVFIKAALLDQSVVAGLGNIYVDEALHLSKIHPQTLANSLRPAQIKRLYEAVKAILSAAVGYGGTSFTHFVNHLGVKGNYLDYARVFRRTGQPCPVCGTPIIKIRVAGRGTHLCPFCQKTPKS